MTGPELDVLVIGGGINGAGVAQAAAAMGYRTLLLERDRFGSGTSSRSSKLVHGGLRYLESLDLGLVRESLAERATLLRVAPALVRLTPIHIPVYAGSARSAAKVRAGLSLYALLGGLAPDVRFRRLPRREWRALDGLRTRDLRAVFRYREAQTDDAALTRAVVESARGLDAVCLEDAEFTGASQVEGGYRIDYRHAGRDRTRTSRVVVNASGPWANAVLARFPGGPELEVDLVRGSHVVLAGSLRAGMYYTEAPRDRRAVFAMPWREGTLVGTTEVLHRGSPDAARATPDEVAYLVETAVHHFPGLDTRVVSSFAGLRVLGRAPGGLNRRSREVIVDPDDPAAPRLLTVVGGKLTGYRATAVRVMRRLRSSLPAPPRRLDTRTLPLAPPDP